MSESVLNVDVDPREIGGNEAQVAGMMWSRGAERGLDVGIGALEAMREAIRELRRDVVQNTIISSGFIPAGKRWRLLRLCGFSVERCLIQAGVFIGSGRLSIGRNVKINYGCFLDPYAGITLEKGVTLGPRCTLLTVSHRIGRPEMRRAPAGEDLLLEEIYVGEGSWLGASVTVLPGVRIGDGTVVGAGSVVLRNCEANAVYAGNPAALVRRLDSEVVPADDSEVVPADDGTAVNGD